MNKILLTILSFCISLSCFAEDTYKTRFNAFTGKQDFINKTIDSSNSSVDTTNFTNNLSSADDTVQKALDTIDDMSSGSSQWSGTAGSIIYYNSANVGIGTSAPSEKLQVFDGYIKGNLQANVGIGKTNPATALDVNGDITCSTLNYSALSPAINVGTGTANYVSKWLTTSTLQDSSIFDNGNVGIGTTNPLTKLSISGDETITGDILMASTKGLKISEGVAGKALSFDGINGVVTVGYKSALNLTGARTYECWFQDPSPSAGYKVLMRRTDDFMLSILNGNDVNWTVDIWDWQGEVYLTGVGPALSAGEWHHLAVTWDRTLGSNQMKAYIDGELWGQSTNTHTYQSNTNDLKFAKHANESNYYSCILDEVRISNTLRYTGNFTPPSSPFVSDENTVLLLHMDEGSGTNVTDSSSNNFTCTATGGVSWVDGIVSGNYVDKYTIKRTSGSPETATGTITLGYSGDAILPYIDNTSNLGSPTYRWANGYFGGNVGIGISAPVYKLDVSGTARVSTSLNTPKLSNLTNNGFVKTSSSDGTLSVDTTTYLSSEADTLNTVCGRGATYTAGNVGIGTTDVTLAAFNTPTIRIGTSTTTGYVLTASNTGIGTWQAATGGTGGVTGSKSFIITNPSSASDGAIWRTPAAITITAVHGVCADGTNIIGHLDECDADGANCAGVDGATDMTITTSNVNDDGTLSNASIDAGDYVGWHTTSVSGSVTKAIITYDYEE